jgi:hypothetical protein
VSAKKYNIIFYYFNQLLGSKKAIII